MKTPRIDWTAIRLEYITTRTTFRALAQKYNTTAALIGQHARKEDWNKQRKKHMEWLSEEALRIAGEQNAVVLGEKLAALQKASDSMISTINTLLEDSEQFQRHIVQARTEEGSSAEEVIFQKFDVRAIRDLTGALRDLTYVVRNVYSIPTEKEQVELLVAREKLRMERERAKAAETEGEETGVIEIAVAEAEAE